MCSRQAEILNPQAYSILDSGDSVTSYDQAKFDLLCAVPSGEKTYGDPVFNIMDPYFNFNITGSMYFEGIRFSGIEAAAQYTVVHFPPVNRIPVKKCKVDKEPLEYLKL